MVFYQRIGDALKWSDPKTAVQLDILERHLVLRWLADGVPFEHLVKLVDTLKEATRLGEGAWTAPPLTEKSRWIDALGAAKDYHRAYGEAASYPPPILGIEALPRASSASVRKECGSKCAMVSEPRSPPRDARPRVSSEEFWNELRHSRHMTTGSLDFYFEYAQARAIRSAGP